MRLCRSGAGDGQTWTASIYNYIQNESVYTCPDDWTPNSNPTGATGAVVMSYAMNLNCMFADTYSGFSGNCTSGIWSGGCAVPVQRQFTAPSVTVWLLESSGLSNNPSNGYQHGSDEAGEGTGFTDHVSDLLGGG